MFRKTQKNNDLPKTKNILSRNITYVGAEFLHLAWQGGDLPFCRPPPPNVTPLNVNGVTNVPSKVRKWAVPQDRLRSEISFSRTCNMPNLISYIQWRS